MGSRMMHLLIANRIAERFSIEDQAALLLGGIAPDAVTSKEVSHFFTGDVTDYSRSIDYEGFLRKYHSQQESYYILGYYTHLIADDIWLKGFYLPWLKNRMEANENLGELYHNDFRLLNGKLLEHYGSKDDLKKLLQVVTPISDLEEVMAKDVEKFLPYVFEDMKYDKEAVNEKLRVFTFEQIVGYIETSIEIGSLKVEQILSKNK